MCTRYLKILLFVVYILPSVCILLPVCSWQCAFCAKQCSFMLLQPGQPFQRSGIHVLYIATLIKHNICLYELLSSELSNFTSYMQSPNEHFKLISLLSFDKRMLMWILSQKLTKSDTSIIQVIYILLTPNTCKVTLQFACAQTEFN